MKTKINYAVAGCAIALSTTGCTEQQPQSQDKPNVLFILVDDLGKEWVEQYGADGVKLPHIQELANESVIFNRAYSMPQSTPSRVAIMTSQYPHNNGWVNHYDVPRWGHGAQFDIENNPSFPRQVRESGYKTCVAGKWQLNDFRLQTEAMVDVGFDNYFMWTGAESGDNVEISGERYWNPYIHSKDGSRQYIGDFGPDLYTKFITDFIDQNHDDPMFIYYPMTLTHTPFVHTPHKMDAKTNYEKHLAMIEYMDILVGRIIKSLKDNGVYDNTYIIFTTDNGTTAAAVGSRNGHYIRGGKTMLSENGINCPFIVKCPNSTSSRMSDAIVDFTDIGPTIMEITGSTPNPKYRVDGVSFLNVLGGDSSTSKGYAISMGGHPSSIGATDRVENRTPFRERAIMGETYKVCLDADRTISRVYDTKSDPWEQNNLLGDPKVMAIVESELGDVIKSLPEVDSHPIYDVIPHDKSLDYDLNASNVKRGGATPVSAFKPLSTQREYEAFINAKPKR